jgi:hypothetical protein
MRGLAALQVPKSNRGRAEDGEALESHRLNLMGMLPINLRHFLADRLGPMLHIEGDSTLAFDPRWGDRAMRELARAIRRFSAERARELWRECSIKLGRLASELSRIPADHRHVVLCLRCVWIGVGPDAVNRHSEAPCLAVELNWALDRNGSVPSNTVRALVEGGARRAIEDFRRRRTAAGQPHFDLDCYLSNDQMVFTWRPLPTQSCVVSAPEPMASAETGSR